VETERNGAGNTGNLSVETERNGAGNTSNLSVETERNGAGNSGDFLKNQPTLLYDIKSVALIVGSFVQLPFEMQELLAS